VLAPGFSELSAGSAERMRMERRGLLDAIHELDGQRRISESERATHEFGQVGGVVDVAADAGCLLEFHEERSRSVMPSLGEQQARRGREPDRELLQFGGCARGRGEVFGFGCRFVRIAALGE
jgi:hypothetical protein